MESPDMNLARALAKWEIIQKREAYDQQKIIQHIDRTIYITKHIHSRLDISVKRKRLEEMKANYESFIKRYGDNFTLIDEICKFGVEIDHCKTELQKTLQLIETDSIDNASRCLVERAILPELPETSDAWAQKREPEDHVYTMLCEPDAEGALPSLEMYEGLKQEARKIIDQIDMGRLREQIQFDRATTKDF